MSNGFRSPPPYPEQPPPHYPHPPQQQPPPDLEGADADLFDYAKLRDYLSFTIHAFKRHRMLAMMVLFGTVTVATLLVKVLPKTYSSEIKIQAQRNQVISTLAGLNRQADDTPTRSAADIVLRHDNLVSLVRKTDLVKRWEDHRSTVLRFKDRLMAKLSGPVKPELREEMMVGTLEQKITVTTAEDSVTIEVQWSDADAAYALVQAAHENFLEARQFREVSAVSEAIGLLEGRLGDQRQKVSDGVERLQRLRAVSKARKGSAKAVVEKPRPRPTAAPADPELAQLRNLMQAKQQAIAELEESHRRKVSEVEAKLAELKQVYSDLHPAVSALELTLAQAKIAPPQLTALREEYRRVEEEYERRGGPVFDATQAAQRATAALPPEALRVTQTLNDEMETADIEQAKNDLRYEVGKYASLLERIDAAKLDRETQRAAFRYRYSVLRPAQVPNAPIKPKAVPIILGAFVAGLLLGVFAAALADVRSRRIYERWQVERLLDMPVLGEVRPP
ncbi:MAG: hypothetical protein JST92_03540 [Deltaproteobacteria bacterium]|nr:hypothetical protein [Deltaproteobacteria bacterium]